MEKSWKCTEGCHCCDEIADLENRLNAAIKLISPDHITPMGIRMLRKVVLRYEEVT